jgi:hypothetical protein
MNIAWRALKGANRRLPERARRMTSATASRLGMTLPRTTDDLARDWATGADAQWIERYRESWDRPYRHVLVDQVGRFEPVSSVVELGCHVGPNLRLLASRFPRARIVGVDVNLPAIEEARRSLAGFPNLTTKCVDLRDELASLEANSVDCIVSCFALAYVAPEDVEDVLRGALEAVRKALVLMEPHPASYQLEEPSGWRHDYLGLLQSVGCADARTKFLQRGVRHGELNAVTIGTKSF